MSAKNTLITLLLTIGLIFGTFVLAQNAAGIDTSVEARKKYRISQLSDEQLRQAWSEAERIRLEEVASIKKMEQDAEARRRQRQKICSDFVYQQRNPDECSTSYLRFKQEANSREAIFDGLVLGMCNFIDGDDIKKLRHFNCIQ